MGQSEKIDRQWQILVMLSKGPVTRVELEEKFGKKRDAINNDIDTLSFHFPIKEGFIGKKRSWEFRSGYKLPGVWFTPRELMALSLGRESVLGDVEGTPYEEAFHSLFAKVERTQSAASRRAAERLPQVYQSDFQSTHDAGDFRESLIQAAEEQRCVKIEYFSAHSNKYSERVVEPFVIRRSIQGLHLIAYCRKRRTVLNFTVNRIQRLELLEERFDATSRRFDLDRYLEESFGGMRSDPVQTYRIKVRYPSAFWAQGLYYHPTQKITELEDGIEISFRSGGEEAVIRRVIGLGEDCELLEPERLRADVVKKLKNLLAIYEPTSA